MIVHLDNNATRPVSAAAFDAMLPFLKEEGGNPSSIHAEGARARAALEEARGGIAAALGCRAAEIHFTSGATESINWALRGVLAARPGPRRLVTSAVEHSVVLDVARRLGREGHEVVVLPVESDGTLDLDRVRSALDAAETALLSLIWSNNETGVRWDVEALGEIARERGVPFHVDAVQVMGKERGLAEAPVDLLSWSGHKFGAAKGVGGLFARRGTRLRPLIWGGHQESALRSGTENVPGIVGMAAALEDDLRRWSERRVEIAELRDRLERGLVAEVPGLVVNGAGAPRVENTLSVCFPGIEGAAVVLTLSSRGVYCSSGSACTASDPGPSHVLRAYGVGGDHVHGAVRFSLSPTTRSEEIEHALEAILAAWRHVARVRAV